MPILCPPLFVLSASSRSLLFLQSITANAFMGRESVTFAARREPTHQIAPCFAPLQMDALMRLTCVNLPQLGGQCVKLQGGAGVRKSQNALLKPVCPDGTDHGGIP